MADDGGGGDDDDDDDDGFSPSPEVQWSLEYTRVFFISTTFWSNEGTSRSNRDVMLSL